MHQRSWQSVFVVGALLAVLVLGLSAPTQAAPGDPAQPVKLSGELVAGGDVSTAGQPVAFTPDSQHIIYLADGATDDQVELYSVPTAGGTPTKLNADLPAADDVAWFIISPDS